MFSRPFKDGNTFKEWEAKAKDYESRLPGTRFIFSDLLERLAPERDKSKGNDLADYLIKQDWRVFKNGIIMANYNSSEQKSMRQVGEEKEKEGCEWDAKILIQIMLTIVFQQLTKALGLQ